VRPIQPTSFFLDLVPAFICTHLGLSKNRVPQKLLFVIIFPTLPWLGFRKRHFQGDTHHPWREWLVDCLHVTCGEVIARMRTAASRFGRPGRRGMTPWDQSVNRDGFFQQVETQFSVQQILGCAEVQVWHYHTKPFSEHPFSQLLILCGSFRMASAMNGSQVLSMIRWVMDCIDPSSDFDLHPISR